RSGSDIVLIGGSADRIPIKVPLNTGCAVRLKSDAASGAESSWATRGYNRLVRCRILNDVGRRLCRGAGGRRGGGDGVAAGAREDGGRAGLTANRATVLIPLIRRCSGRCRCERQRLLGAGLVLCA